MGEYGSTTHRPHYHVTLFTDNHDIDSIIFDTWAKGFITVTRLTESRIMYTLKFHINTDTDYKPEVKQFAIMSKKLGYNYVRKASKFHQNNLDGCYYSLYEKKMPLPRYLKNKLYIRRELEQINKEKEANMLKINKIEENRKIKMKGGKNYFKEEKTKIDNLVKNHKKKKTDGNKPTI